MLEALAALAMGHAQLGWRAGTPEPVLDGDPAWIGLYWKAWENLYAATIEETEPGPWPARVFAEEGTISFDRALAISLYARWGWRAHPVRETLNFVLMRIDEQGFAPAAFSHDAQTGEATGPPLAALSSLRLASITANEADLLIQTGAVQRRNAYIAGRYTFTTVPASKDEKPKIGYRVPPEWSIAPTATDPPGPINAEAVALLLQDTHAAASLYRAGGHRRAAETLDRVSKDLAAHLRGLWRKDERRFSARDESGNMEPDSLAILWGLIGGAMPKEMANDALQGLLSPSRFYRRTLFPTAAGRGFVRPLHSYLALRALIDNGMHKEAGRAAETMLSVYTAAAGAGKALYDIYGSETRLPADGAKPGGLEAGTVAIAGLIEAVIGIDVDARAERIDWFLRRRDRHGIKNLRFGENVVTLIANAREDGGEPVIEVECAEDFRLNVTVGERKFSKRFASGKHTWKPAT
ncbi:MAG: hypothetical protein M3R13_10085 [Armatimonadota bacterium]|nr:hypothetical protein [Armatimonadota bacterium]